MKLRLQKRRGFTLVELLVVVSIILALAGMSYPLIMSRLWQAEKVKITNNSKNIMIAMNEFDRTFQSYPDDTTAQRIEENPAYKKVDGLVLTGDTANPYFRQLLASGMMETEEPFYAQITSKISGRTIEPDNRIDSGMGIARGENGFCYVMIDRGDSTMGISGSGSSGSTPVLVSLVMETANAAAATYDTEALKGEVFVIRGDNASKFLKLDDNGYTIELFRKDNRGRETAQDYKVLKADL